MILDPRLCALVHRGFFRHFAIFLAVFVFICCLSLLSERTAAGHSSSASCAGMTGFRVRVARTTRPLVREALKLFLTQGSVVLRNWGP